MASDADRLIEQLRAGGRRCFPTDTVYGLVSTPGEARSRRALRAQGPPARAADGAARREHRAAARSRSRAAMRVACSSAAAGAVHARAAEPGAAFPLAGRAATATRSAFGFQHSRPRPRRVLEAVGCVAATSANEPGGPDPRTLADVPARLRDACPALDAGRSPGTPSTVIDLTGAEAAWSSAKAPFPSAEAIAPRPEGASTIRVMAVAHADVRRAEDARARRDRPGDRRAARARARSAARPDRADRLRELHVAERARGGRLGADEQVRRGLSGQALLRRLRGRRRDRGDRAQPRDRAVRRRARERAAARGRAGEHGGLLRRAQARRPRARPLARPRRPPDARPEGQLLGEALRVPPLRRLPRDDAASTTTRCSRRRRRCGRS